VRATAAALLLLLATACGGGGAGGAGGLEGSWVVDVAATFGVAPSPVPGESPAAAGVRERFAPGACRLDLAAGGTFAMSVAAGADVLRVEGTWVALADGVRLVATTVGGAPATPEERAPEELRSRAGALVLEGAGGRDVVWRR
jgi:hypothetical protein